MAKRHERWLHRLAQQVRRKNQAERDRFTLFSQASYLGVLGLVLVLPIVGGAYMGVWLDEQRIGYSISWTLNLILLGVVVGVVNVFYLIRERD